MGGCPPAQTMQASHLLEAGVIRSSRFGYLKPYGYGEDSESFLNPGRSRIMLNKGFNCTGVFVTPITEANNLQISESTHGLFNKMCIPSHCLHHLLPDHRVSDNLRLHGHGFQLPTNSTVLHRNSFVTRSLFLYVWILMCVCLIIFNKRLFKGCSQ